MCNAIKDSVSKASTQSWWDYAGNMVAQGNPLKLIQAEKSGLK